MKAPVGLSSGSTVCVANGGVSLRQVLDHVDSNFSSIENLWPQVDTCFRPFRATLKISEVEPQCTLKIFAEQNMWKGQSPCSWSPFTPNAVPTPVLQRRCPARPQKVWGYGAVSRSDGLCKIQCTVWGKPDAVRTLQPASFKHKNNTFQLCSQQPKTNFWRLNNYIRFYLWKRKITAHAAQRWFCRVNRRQNESGVLRGGKKSSWGINPRHSVLFYKFGGICDKGYHGMRRASRWFCKFYCSKAVIVGLMWWWISCFQIFWCVISCY